MPKRPTERKTRITMQVPLSLDKFFTDLARQQFSSKSAVIRMVLAQYAAREQAL